MEEVVRGDLGDLDKLLRYDKVIVNIIGTSVYNPALPNVYKWDQVNHCVLGEIIVYVDNLRAIGCIMEAAWAITRQVASGLQHLGIKDAPRRRRVAEGPWARGIYQTANGCITKTVTLVKWKKGQDQLDEVLGWKEKR